MTTAGAFPAAGCEGVSVVVWTIAVVARMTGVTSRTLRHYDEIGLLPPAGTAANGYRLYEEEQLLRLQEVLLLRELGLGLEVIAQVLDGRRDRVEALRRHEQHLRAEALRIARLADTVAHTVEHVTGGTTMTAPQMFEGFEADRAATEEQLVARYGDGVREHFATARERTAGWTPGAFEDARREMEAFDDRAVALLEAGATPGDPEVTALVADHHASVSRHWTPDAASYTGLGGWYVEDPRFRERFDARHPGLAVFWRDALAAYAAEHLA